MVLTTFFFAFLHTIKLPQYIWKGNLLLLKCIPSFSHERRILGPLLECRLRMACGLTSYSKVYDYHKVASSNMSCLEAHADFLRLLLKGILDPYVLWPFVKKLISWLVTLVRTRNYTVYLLYSVLTYFYVENHH